MRYKNLKGYSYLRYIRDTKELPFEMMEIYEDTAKKFNTNVRSVERNIRYFIHKNGIDKTNAEYIADILVEKEEKLDRISELESMLEDLKNYKEHSRPLTAYEEIGMKESDF